MNTPIDYRKGYVEAVINVYGDWKHMDDTVLAEAVLVLAKGGIGRYEDAQETGAIGVEALEDLWVTNQIYEQIYSDSTALLQKARDAEDAVRELKAQLDDAEAKERAVKQEINGFASGFFDGKIGKRIAEAKGIEVEVGKTEPVTIGSGGVSVSGVG
jgi:hypothetical protein